MAFLQKWIHFWNMAFACIPPLILIYLVLVFFFNLDKWLNIWKHHNYYKIFVRFVKRQNVQTLENVGEETKGQQLQPSWWALILWQAFDFFILNCSVYYIPQKSFLYIKLYKSFSLVNDSCISSNELLIG